MRKLEKQSRRSSLQRPAVLGQTRHGQRGPPRAEAVGLGTEVCVVSSSFAGKGTFHSNNAMCSQDSQAPQSVTSVTVKPQNSFPKFQSEPSGTTRHGLSLLPARAPAVALASQGPRPTSSRVPEVTERGCRTRAELKEP